MNSDNKNLSAYDRDLLSCTYLWRLRIAIVVSRQHQSITDKLYKACYDTLIEYGVSNISTTYAPGTFELPACANMMAEREIRNRYYSDRSMFMKRGTSAFICIGCVIKGETNHNEYISMSVANGLQNLAIKWDRPFIFGVITSDSREQAEERAGGKYGNKGVEAAKAALYTGIRTMWTEL